MDENTQLTKIRELVRQIQNAHVIGGALGAGLKRDRAIELAAAIEELDEHLSGNGMLPLAWLPPEAVKGGTAGTGLILRQPEMVGAQLFNEKCPACGKYGCHDIAHKGQK